MNFALGETIDLLQRTPVLLETMLRGAAEGWLSADEGDGTWNPRGVLGHLIVGEETDWIPRARIILEHGESRPFDPFDRFAQFERYDGWPVAKLLDRFAETRRESLAVLASWNLAEDQLDLRGRHPELGTVTLRQLLATWAVHDLDHVVQISRVMARRYADDVGVWKEYLRVVRE
jgi:hypothetical protein